MTEYYVQVWPYEGGKLVKEVGPLTERKADKVDDGMQHNLNHDEYYTLIVKIEDDQWNH